MEYVTYAQVPTRKLIDCMPLIQHAATATGLDWSRLVEEQPPLGMNSSPGVPQDSLSRRHGLEGGMRNFLVQAFVPRHY